MSIALVALVVLLGLTFVVATCVVLLAMWRLLDAKKSITQKAESPKPDMASFLDPETRAVLQKVGTYVREHYPTYHSGWDFCGECTKRGKPPYVPPAPYVAPIEKPKEKKMPKEKKSDAEIAKFVCGDCKASYFAELVERDGQWGIGERVEAPAGEWKGRVQRMLCGDCRGKGGASDQLQNIIERQRQQMRDMGL